jgi:hypothetical protein
LHSQFIPGNFVLKTNRMRILPVILALFLCVPAFAQDTTAKKIKEPRRIHLKPPGAVNDSIPGAGPNEISFNLSPVVVTVLGGAPGYESRFSLFYKRSLENPRAAFRAGILFRPQSRNPFFSSDPWYFNETDSTRTRNEFHYNTAKPWQLSLGMEWRSKGAHHKRVSGFISADAIAGFYNQNYSLFDFAEKKDSTGQWTSVMFATNSVVQLDNKRARNWYAGINPNVGVRYAFGRHWLVFLQTGVDIVYAHHEQYTRSGLGTSLVKESWESLDLNISGMFNEFAIVYRF